MIQTKDKRLVTLAPNRVQAAYLDQICPAWRAGDYTLHGAREMILKARQFGFSTLIGALFFLNTYNTPNTNTIVIADNLDNTEALFRKVKLFYDGLADDKKLRTTTYSRRMLQWPDLGSTYQVLTAGRKGAGRSRTVHNLHMSERPFWESDAILTGLLQTVPPGGNIFDESTANGEGNDFHSDYRTAERGESPYEARFFAWFEHDEYQTPPPPGFAPVTVGAAPALLGRYGDEAKLARDHTLTDAQLFWRRNKIQEPGMGSMFPQEYPSDPVEAFRVSGSRFFDDWDEDVHVCLPFDIPAHWVPLAAYDWGFAAPCCLLIGYVDEFGGVVIADEVYAPKLTNDEQAERVVRTLAGHGLPKNLWVNADQSMWQRKNQQSGVGKADVEDFHRRGLNFAPAAKNGTAAWSVLREYLAATMPDGTAKLRVFRGRCPNLVRTMPLMKHDDKKPEEMDDTGEDHAPATAAYLLNRHIAPAPAPQNEHALHEKLGLVPYDKSEGGHW